MRECPLLMKYGITTEDSCSENSKKDWAKNICLFNCPLLDCLVFQKRKPTKEQLRVLANTTLTISIIRQRDKQAPETEFWK